MGAPCVVLHPAVLATAMCSAPAELCWPQLCAQPVLLRLVQGTAAWSQVFSRQLIVLTGAAAELVGPSVSYLKIRAWSAPAVLITMVAQVSPAAAQHLCMQGISSALCWPQCPLCTSVQLPPPTGVPS